MSEPSFCHHYGAHLLPILRGRAQAAAQIKGGEKYPGISGAVHFFQTNNGVIVCAEIYGLPQGGGACRERVLGFHIHDGSSCGGGDGDEPFASALAHYDPNGCGHPQHAGDLPPLFESNGAALSAFLTNRFTVEDVTGKTVVIHDHSDDFTTQPSGNSGTKIACGVIRRTKASCQ